MQFFQNDWMATINTTLQQQTNKQQGQQQTIRTDNYVYPTIAHKKYNQ